MLEKTYWVMYSETAPTQAGDTICRNVQYYGTADFDTAMSSILTLRDRASKGQHILNSKQWPGHVINSAWLEASLRGPVDELEALLDDAEAHRDYVEAVNHAAEASAAEHLNESLSPPDDATPLACTHGNHPYSCSQCRIEEML